MTRVRYSETIDGEPAAVFRLVSELEKWPALYPHVRSVVELQLGRWQVEVSWRWLPLRFVAARRVSPADMTVEYRLGAAAGLRLVSSWTVAATQAGKTTLTADVVMVRGPWLLRSPLMRFVVPELMTRTLAMTRLLAEADRKAHEDIAP